MYLWSRLDVCMCSDLFVFYPEVSVFAQSWWCFCLVFVFQLLLQEEEEFTKAAMEKVQGSYLHSLQEVADLLKKRAETVKNLKIWTSSHFKLMRTVPHRHVTLCQPVCLWYWILSCSVGSHLRCFFFIHPTLTQTSEASADVRTHKSVGKLLNLYSCK